MKPLHIRAAAERLYRDHIRPTLGPGFAAEVEVGSPVVVRQYQGPGRFWYAPLRAFGREVGFAHLSESGDLLRYGTWVQSRDEASSFPPGTTEMSPEAVCKQAQTAAEPLAEPLASPELVFLGFQTRIAWACPFRMPDGREETVFVTPDYAWRGEPGVGDAE